MREQFFLDCYNFLYAHVKLDLYMEISVYLTAVEM